MPEIREKTEEKIKVAVMGLPRPEAWAMAEAIANSRDLELMPVSLTDSKTIVDSVTVGGVPIRLFTLERRQSMLFGVNPDVVADCMGLKAVQNNIEFYDKNKLPFVVGTPLGADLSIKEDATFQAMKILLDLNSELTKNYDFKVKEGQRSISFAFTRKKNKIETSKTVEEMIAFRAIKNFIMATPKLLKRYAMKITNNKQGISFMFTCKITIVEETMGIIRSLPKKESKNENIPWYDILAGKEKDWSLGNHILREEEKALQREVNEMLRRKSRRGN